jgi:FlaA1/EpsC-like NDP-sugar epimerase
MTTEEAVQLVLQAGAIGGPGEVLILDMGKPVRILEVAERLIAASGKDVGIVFTGLREGEKLHEELIGSDERDLRPHHPLITHATVPPLDPEEALKLAPWDRSPRDLIADLARLC